MITWAIIAASVAGVIFRPFGWKEVYFALAGAAALVVLGLLPLRAALHGAGQGADVYLFLTGMMLLAELASSQGLFAWAAGWAATCAQGSATRLFGMGYSMAVVVTVFLSNDATAVVLTPAVAAMARAAKAENPLPFVLICAFVANAASFVLPISNPANLVIYAGAMPPLWDWLGRFGLASLLSIAATFMMLWLTQRGALRQKIAVPEDAPGLSRGGKMTGYGLIATAVLLILASAFGLKLGLPTCLAGFGTAALVLVPSRTPPWALLKTVAWSVLFLVAGLFIMVTALDRTGVASGLAALLRGHAPWLVGLGLGVTTNLVNNLPAALLAGHALTHASPNLTSAALIGADLGPNLSVTGSLATILWLTALRRAGLHISAWQFLRLGALVMPPALVLALLAIR